MAVVSFCTIVCLNTLQNGSVMVYKTQQQVWCVHLASGLIIVLYTIVLQTGLMERTNTHNLQDFNYIAFAL